MGHTHADIDGKFGKIWKKIRSLHVLTPQDYATLIHSALKSDKYETTVEDIFVVPDYKSLLEPFVDKNFNK